VRRSPTSDTARHSGWAPAWACVTLLLTVLAGPAAASPLDVRSAPPETRGVEVVPAVARVPQDGRAAVVVRVGVDAVDELLITFVLRSVQVTRDGVASAGAPLPPDDGTVTTDAIRIAPGEQVTVPVTIADEVAILEAVARPADDLDGEVVVVRSLLLPGVPDATPTLAVAVTSADQDLTQSGATATAAVTVTVSAPTVLSLRVEGAGTTTLLSRLVLPNQPLVAKANAASWPRATTAVITIEGGDTVWAASGTSGLVWIAGLVLALALAALGHAIRQARAELPAAPDA
jgi:hypothetical protein